MTKGFYLSGVAAFAVAVYATGAVAQQADASGTQPPRQSTCSGLMCIFHGGRTAEPAATVDAKTAAERAAALPADVDDTPVATKSGANEPGATKSRAKKQSEASARTRPSMPVITIAADAPEAGRLKQLAATLPKSRIKIVGLSATKHADFSVAIALDRDAAADKTKLFTEPMHVVAGAGVHSISDLKGRVVSFGPDKGPTQIAARKAFQSLGVAVKETPLDLENALDGLSTGDVDAVVILAPEPVDRLKKLKAPGLHLVAWPEGAARTAGASESNIDPAFYPGLANAGQRIHALGVDVVLNLEPKGAKDSGARSFLTSLAQHSAALSKRGFDLIKADGADRNGRRIASAERQ